MKERVRERERERGIGRERGSSSTLQNEPFTLPIISVWSEG